MQSDRYAMQSLQVSEKQILKYLEIMDLFVFQVLNYCRNLAQSTAGPMRNNK